MSTAKAPAAPSDRICEKYIKYTVSEDERAALFETAGRVRARESIE